MFMRLTESKLRSIIRSVLSESDVGADSNEFNSRYGDLMLKTGSDSYDISPDYVERIRAYEKLDSACRKGYTSYGNIDEFEAARIFSEIGCNCKYFSGSWFADNATNILSCLENASIPERRVFFAEIDALLNH